MGEKLKIAVCDDEAKALTIISASVTHIFENIGIEVSLESFMGHLELLERVGKRAFDLIFLDISMPKMDGIKLGKAIQKSGSTAEIVFISNRTDRMFETFSVEPFGFVRKNHFIEDLNEVIMRFVEKHKVNQESDMVWFHDGHGTLAVDISRVKYIECIRNMQVLHFGDEVAEHKIYSRMETLAEELKKHGFIRIHKSYLVSGKFIKRFDSKVLILTTGEELPVGRSRLQEAKAEYLAYVSSIGASYIGKM